MGGKTGCLSVSDGEIHGEIFLDGGKISYAEVATHRDHFAEKLVRKGRITRSQLDEAISLRQSGSDRPLGHILVDSGHVERDEVERMLRIQAEEAVYLLFGWKQGQFTFVTSRRPPYHAFAISLDAENLLLEGARRVDEWDLIRRKIPSFDLVYRRSGSSLGLAAAELTENQEKVLPLLDGTRDVASVVDVTGMSEYDVGKALYGLVMAGFVQLLERRSRVRHLEYREVLAYLVKEAEFADPDRRKDAARHIADCPSCAKRLRNIHVRRTEGSGILELPIEVVAESEEAFADLMEPMAQAVGGETAGYVAGRIQDRRMVQDRRAEDRRRGLDRRRTTDPAWLTDNVDRRVSSRRTTERRSQPGRYRRSDDYSRGSTMGMVTQGIIVTGGPGRGGAALAARGGAMPAMPMPNTRRVTEVRQTTPHRRPAPAPAPAETQSEESTQETPAAKAPAAANPPAAPTITPPAMTPPAAAAPSAPQPEAAPETEAAPPPTASAPPAKAPVTPIPITPARRKSDPGRARESSQDIVWLTSPEETTEMIRRESKARDRKSSGGYTPARISRTTPAGKPEPARRASPSLPLAPLVLPPVPLTIPMPRPSRSTPRLTNHAAKRRAWRNRALLMSGLAGMALAASYGAIQLRGGTVKSGTSAASFVTAAPASTPPVSPHPALPTTPELIAPTPAPETTAAAASHVPEPVSVARNPSAVSHTDVNVASTDARAAAAAAAKIRRDSLAAARRDSVAAAARDRVAVAVAPLSADTELAAGGWTAMNKTEAAATIGGTLAQIQGLRIESVTTSSVGGRPRVRVAQIARSGQRIVLMEMSSGAPAGAHPYHPADVNVSPAEGLSIGTATLGTAFITAKSMMAADDLRPLLQKLGEVR
jgi:hypothetical protein